MLSRYTSAQRATVPDSFIYAVRRSLAIQLPATYLGIDDHEMDFLVDARRNAHSAAWAASEIIRNRLDDGVSARLIVLR